MLDLKEKIFSQPVNEYICVNPSFFQNLHGGK